VHKRDRATNRNAAQRTYICTYVRTKVYIHTYLCTYVHVYIQSVISTHIVCLFTYVGHRLRDYKPRRSERVNVCFKSYQGSSKTQNGLHNFLVPAYIGCPGKRPLNGCSVVVVVTVSHIR